MSKKKKRQLVVGIFVDPITDDRDKEVQYIKRIFQDFFPNVQFLFLVFDNIGEITGRSMDVFVIDYGGIMPGASFLTETISESLYKYSVDNPSCIVVLWSKMTADECIEYVEGEMGKCADDFNMLICVGGNMDKFWERLKEKIYGKKGM